MNATCYTGLESSVIFGVTAVFTLQCLFVAEEALVAGFSVGHSCHCVQSVEFDFIPAT